ncbi:hypothetical protein ACVME8_003627 [Bradyrhizobium diazoefficiens]
MYITGLGERRLVALVMAMPAVAEHVDDDGLVELLPEFGRDLGREHHGFRIVAVHMEDRRVDHLRHIRRIGRGTRVTRIGGEADLVVDDEVHGAAGAVALQVRQTEAFRDHALAGERGVAVHQQRHDGDAHIRRIAVLVLLGADLAEHDGIDDLEMRGIGGQRQMDAVAVELAVRGGAEMILDVAGAFDRVRVGRAALELVEQRAVGLAHHLGQHVEAAAMRHAQHDFLHAEIAAALDDLLERGDQGFSTVETETLGAGKLGIAELFEAFGFDQLGQDGSAALAGEGDFLIGPLDALLDPGLLRGIADMHELDAERLAVGALADRGDLAQRAVFEAEHVIEEDLAVKIGLAEAVGARVELFAVARRLDAERIELGVEVAAHAVGADQHQGADRVARRLEQIGGGDIGALGLRLGGDLAADRLLDLGPIAVEGGGQVVLRRQRPVGALPGRALGVPADVVRLVLQALEELLPLGVDRGRVLLVAGVDFVDVGGVGALQKR